MRKWIAIILACAMAVTLFACGKDENNPNIGVYYGVSVEMLGETMAMDEVYDGTTKLELRSGGKGVFTIDGSPAECTWALEGETLSVTMSFITSKGTLKDGIIQLNYLDMMVMTFARDGVEIPTEGSAGGNVDTEPVREQTAGYYKAFSLTMEGQTYDRSDMESMELADSIYLVLNEDYTGRIALADGETEITYDEQCFYSMGEELPYTLEDGQITVSLDAMTFVFLRSDEVPPDPLFLDAFPGEFAEEMHGDWHGWTVCVDGTGKFEANLDDEFEVIARFVFDEDGTCIPFIAFALSESSNFQDLAASYNQNGDVMMLEGTVFDVPVLNYTNLYCMDGVLHMELYAEDDSGNYIECVAAMRRLDEEWDYTSDYPALPADAVAFYQGMSFLEIAELYELDLQLIPELPPNHGKAGQP